MSIFFKAYSGNICKKLLLIPFQKESEHIIIYINST